MDRRGAHLELRVLELEDTVTAMTRVIGTMADMLSGLNGIAAHYADTVAALLPLPAVRQLRPPATEVLGESGAGRCGGECACAASDPDDDGRC